MKNLCKRNYSKNYNNLHIQTINFNNNTNSAKIAFNLDNNCIKNYVP